MFCISVSNTYVKLPGQVAIPQPFSVGDSKSRNLFTGVLVKKLMHIENHQSMSKSTTVWAFAYYSYTFSIISTVSNTTAPVLVAIPQPFSIWVAKRSQNLFTAFSGMLMNVENYQYMLITTKLRVSIVQLVGRYSAFLFQIQLSGQVAIPQSFSVGDSKGRNLFTEFFSKLVDVENNQPTSISTTARVVAL